MNYIIFELYRLADSLIHQRIPSPLGRPQWPPRSHNVLLRRPRHIRIRHLQRLADLFESHGTVEPDKLLTMSSISTNTLSFFPTPFPTPNATPGGVHINKWTQYSGLFTIISVGMFSI